MGENREKIDEVLLKVALGYQLAEVTEEYAEVDGALKLTKRKKTKKDVPPDLKAVQLLLGDTSGVGVESMTDAQLEEEKQRLLQALLQAQQEKATGQVCDQKAKKATSGEKTAVRKPRAKPRKKVTHKKGEVKK